MLIQLVLILILLVALATTWKRARQGVVSRVEAVLWSLLWIGAGVVVALPQTATFVANRFGIGRGADFVVYLSVIALFMLVFRVFVALDRIERNIATMAKGVALSVIPTDRSQTEGAEESLLDVTSDVSDSSTRRTRSE